MINFKLLSTYQYFDAIITTLRDISPKTGMLMLCLNSEPHKCTYRASRDYGFMKSSS